jgi:hypothetical protein
MGMGMGIPATSVTHGMYCTQARIHNFNRWALRNFLRSFLRQHKKTSRLCTPMMRSLAILCLCVAARAAAQCTGAKTVNFAIANTNDAAKVAAAAACPNKVIQVTLKAAITLTKPIVVSASTSLSINGANNTAASFSGNSKAQLFDVQGNLTLTGVTLQDAFSQDYGGAINSTASAVISITGCHFQSCKAEKGGAIHNAGNLAIKNSGFQNNSATLSGGSIEAGTGSELSISSTLFDSNLAGKQLHHQSYIILNHICSCAVLLIQAHEW